MRMLVFPYGRDCEPIVRHAGLLEPCYEIAALVSPGGWGMAGKDITVVDSGAILPVYEKIQEVTEEFDSLFIPPFEVFGKEVENRLVDEMLRLIPCISHVIYASRLASENHKKLEEACLLSGEACSFIDFSEYKEPKVFSLAEPIEEYPSLIPLDVPVAVVAGWWERTDKFEVSLALREQFLKRGYHVSQVGSRDGCEMFGFHSFPSFMFRKDVDAVAKIIYFNRWIVEVARKERPDLLLVTIPGAIQNFNEQFTRGFGIMHHQVFQAVAPDILVMCTFYMSVSKKILEDMSRFCEYRFGVPVDAFHMSNLYIDVNESEVQNRIITKSIYRENVSEAIAKETAASIPVFNGLDIGECTKVAELILEKLVPEEFWEVV